ncbi:4-diphosphocytidyl-2-C-methyl-D-erythritol kinase [Balneicella halophila]|uniref:4-diphosphocytidyl-2-C-methyl-D-erythritol kinase n=1 Tax=Balneicella halophila TaxID=1537566 RepID=A0A7L4UNI0_BALHA|nr:4-(cytidine 5'-diphospho)-2-C-methyl-D-erythritol kinase [Balneicella halophila]PVX50025.1 4-diphosphocytidyl-2-C-methyl-D-erythritol kinase [Balneicella halophila]
MISFPNAKINIGLYITEKRDDGYHNIETILYPIPLKDALEIRKSKTGKTNYQNSGIKIDDIDYEQTSVMKAYHLLRERYSLPPIDIILYKNIPYGAGLGGGSADAAFMLKLLNQYFNLNLTVEELESHASELGSDDPFFIKNTPQLATGRGENLKEVSVDLKGHYLVLLKPDIFISTATAYKNTVPKSSNFDLKSVDQLPIAEWEENIKNDFEDGLFLQFPLLEELKSELYRNGAIYASLSGSGSSIYGIFESKPQLSTLLKNNLLWQGLL